MFLRLMAVVVAVIVSAGLLVAWIGPMRLLAAAVIDIPHLAYPQFPTPEELQKSAESIVSSRNDFHGRAPMLELRERLESSQGSDADRAELLRDLAIELIRLGNADEAARTIEQAVELARQNGPESKLASIHLARALVYLRVAELQNCLDEHCEDSCLYPIQHGGIHRRKDAAEAARESLTAYLATNPHDRLGAIWLLNIVSMTLGDFPQGVPKEFQVLPKSIDPAALHFPRFYDAAPALGLNRMSCAGGVAIDDYDQDGFLDVLSTGSQPFEPLLLYRNLGDGQFEERSASAGLDGQTGGLQCQFVDVTGDGWLDIFVTRGAWFMAQGRVRNSLLRNNQDGTFQDITRESGLAYPAYPTQTAVWGDFDHNRWLDVFIGNESLGELIGLGRGRHPSQLFFQNKRGLMRDHADWAGVLDYALVKGAAAGDFDGDGHLDLFVSRHSVYNDPHYGTNRLYRNLTDGRFEEVAQDFGVSDLLQSFPAFFFDFNNDGWLDLFVGSYGQDLRADGDPLAPATRDGWGQPHEGASPKLYLNQTGKGFVDISREVGLDHPWLVMGACFGDLDNDGWLDIYLGTGGPAYQSLVPNIMLKNDQGRRFIDVTIPGGFGHLQKGHGISFADIDNDGDQDVYADMGGFYTGDVFTNSLFLNPGFGNRFLKISFKGKKSNSMGYGARVRVTVETKEGDLIVHRAQGSNPSFGNVPSRMEIGLGPAVRIKELKIRWPNSMKNQIFTDVPLDSWIVVEEGADTFEQRELKAVDLESVVKAHHASSAGDVHHDPAHEHDSSHHHHR